MDPLKGARVLVTGASSGIGLAAARRFADAGAEVALLARSEAVERAAQDIGGVAERADITDRGSLAPAIERLVERLGGLDVAVVNAGGAAYGRFAETPPEDFDRAVGLTLLGAVNTVRCVLPHLERSDGRLVVVSSVASRAPLPLQSSYVAAKHGLRGFLRSLRTELTGSGSRVKVTEIEPGPVDTPFWNNGTSATGRLAPRYPGAYTAGTVADAVVAAAVRPRRRVTVGWAMGVAVGGAYGLFPGPVERLMGWAGRVAHPRGPQTHSRGVLHEPMGQGEISGGLPLSRPSLRATLMRVLG
jgi:NAD(P)-dependent dehydrogenase (short-subunit alcohol dehydrogenase family)